MTYTDEPVYSKTIIFRSGDKDRILATSYIITPGKSMKPIRMGLSDSAETILPRELEDDVTGLLTDFSDYANAVLTTAHINHRTRTVTIDQIFNPSVYKEMRGRFAKLRRKAMIHAG